MSHTWHRIRSETWSLDVDGRVIGYMRRMPTKGGHSEVFRVSTDMQSWQGAFLDRKTAREYLQNV